MTPIRLVLFAPALALAGCAGMQADSLRPASKPAAPAAGVTQAAAVAPPVAPPAPEDLPPPAPEEVKAAAAITRAPKPRPAARATAAQLDTTTRAQKVAAAAPAEKPEAKLGTTIASLGDPTEPGFWIKTPLVKDRRIGRIVNPVNGKSAKVDLIPLPGPSTAGSQVSLPALQLLGVSLTELPEIEVWRS